MQALHIFLDQYLPLPLTILLNPGPNIDFSSRKSEKKEEKEKKDACKLIATWCDIT